LKEQEKIVSATQYSRYLICCMSMFLAVSAAFAQNETQDAARRHMVRGVAAIEMAKTESDMRAAADEFRRATEIDPKLAGAWYNLGAVQAKLQDHAGAIASYKHYLELEPSSEDAPRVRDEIIKLEYRLERTAKQQSLAGKWSGDSTVYTLTLNGNEFRMQSAQPANWNPWAEKSLTLYFKDMFGMLNERTPEKITANVAYEGRIDGDRITGERVRDAYDNEQSACRIPAHRAAFEGKVENDGNLITITFEDPHYRAEYSSVFFGMQNCINVSVDGTVKREVKYFRQKMLMVVI
jgi:tetratricopeptide (TPR) repeat protein